MTWIRHPAAIAAIFVFAAVAPGFAGTFYSGSNNDSLMSIDIGTGSGTIIGPMGAAGVFAGAFSPGGVFYTVTGTYSDDVYLATVNLTTGHVTSVAPVANHEIDMLQFSPSGGLYASEGFSLYRMDPLTASLVTIGPFGIPGNTGGMMDLAMDSHGVLYGVASNVSDTGDSYFYTIDTSTGQAALLFSVATPCIMGMAFDPSDHLFATTYCVANSPFYSVDLANASVSIEALSGVPYPHGGDIPRIPEPATFVVLGSSLMVVGALRRIRRRATGGDGPGQAS